MSKAKKPYTPSEQLKAQIAQFEAAEKLYNAAWEYFSQLHAVEIAHLDKLRDQRNAFVTELKKLAREEAVNIDPEIYGKTIKAGPITIQKGESYWYVADRFIEMVTEAGLLDAAKDAGCIKQTVDIDKKTAEEFCVARDIGSRLEKCKDSKETSPAIKGLKRIADFNMEVD